MEQIDYEMRDTVMDSTEINGHHDTSTVDPSIISLNGHNLQMPPIRERLPIHSHGQSLKSTSVFSISSTHQSNSLPGAVASASHSRQLSLDSESDEMDIESSAPPIVEVRMPPPPRFPPLPYATKRTGLVYDSRMRLHVEPVSMAIRENDIHPEDPRRIHEIFQEIQQAGLVQGAEDPEEEASDEQCWRIHARPASKAEICLVHNPSHYEFIYSLQDMLESELTDYANALDSIYFHNSTFECATLAAGGAIEACRAVVRGDVKNSIAIIRPPGHHAESDQPSGFCIFNNVPIAAKVCQNDFPNECRKVLILDWDVHHGNGVQHAFYDDPNVLYISLHVYKNGTFYPNMPDANYDYCGEGAGIGKNVNIPWADHGMGDAEYLYAFQEIVMPIAFEFNPDLVIISAGFDAAEGDMLGGCHVSPACYAHMTRSLLNLANGKMAVCLEGGYNLRSIARSALAVTRTLMGEPPERLDDEARQGVNELALETIQQVKRAHSKYWKCLYPKHLDTEDPSFSATRRLHEIIRKWQSQTLSEEYHMTPLIISKAGIAQSFEHNVIATPKFMERHPLLVIFHDPPEVQSISDPVSGKADLHNTWLTDITKRYVGWAVQNGFQVIDVNIPKMVVIEDDDGGYVKAEDNDARAHQTKELAGYIWENYIEPYEAPQVFFMGIGAAYLGLVDTLSKYDACTEPESPIECLIGFVADCSINSIKRPADDDIGSWYHRHSLIFVQNSHPAWDPRRKRRKKYGNLQRSPENHLNEMLLAHEDEVRHLLLSKKTDFEEAEQKNSRLAKSKQQALRSPPLPRESTPRINNRHGSVPTSTKGSPSMPQIGFFNVNMSNSPKSPLKKGFGSGYGSG